MFFGHQENSNYRAEVFLKVLIFLSANLISDIKLAERSTAYVYQRTRKKTVEQLSKMFGTVLVTSL